jgi:hypothetical protein
VGNLILNSRQYRVSFPIEIILGSLMGTDLKHDSCPNLFVWPRKIDSDEMKRMEALDATSGFRLLHCRGSLCEACRMILYARDGSDHHLRRCYRFACSELVGL